MVSEDEKVAIIRSCETFANAPDDTLEHLGQGFVERHCEEGENLIVQGERGGSLFLILEGEFGVFTAREGGGEDQVAMVAAGELCGEIGAVSGIDATASVRALSDGRVLELDEKRFHEAMYHSPRLAETVLRAMTRYL